MKIPSNISILSAALIAVCVGTSVSAQTQTSVPVLRPKSTPTKASPPQAGKPVPPKGRSLQSMWPVLSPDNPALSLVDGKLLFERSLAYLTKGKFDEALSSLLDAVKIEPKRYEVHFLLGVTYVELNRLDKALTAFQKAVSLNPSNAQVHSALCFALAKSDNRIAAINECREAVRLDPQSSQFHAQLAGLYVLDGRLDEAVRLIEAVDIKSKDDLVLSGTRGDIYYASGDYVRATEIYEGIASKWPSVPTTYLRLSGVYDYLERPVDAIKAAKKFAELQPKLAFAHFNLGEIFRTTGFFDESIEPLRKSISIDPSLGPAYLGLSESYEAIGDEQNALESLRHAYKYLPPDFYLSYRLGQALNGFGRMADAVEPLERAYSMESQATDVMASLGLAYFESNQFDKAIEILAKADQIHPNDQLITMFLRVANGRKEIANNFENILGAVKTNPSNPTAMAQLANAYRYRGMLKEAEKEYIEIIDLTPKDFNAYNFLAIFYNDIGQTEKALEFHRKAAELNPHHVLYSAIAGDLEKLGKLDEAIVAARRSVEIKGTLLETRIQLGQLLQKRGLLSEALGEFQAAFDMAPGRATPSFRMAWLYIRMGNKDGALRHYGFLKAIVPNELKYLERSLRAHFAQIP